MEKKQHLAVTIISIVAIGVFVALLCTAHVPTKRNLNAYTAESVLPIRKKNFITGRFRIGAYTIGYTRDFDLFPHVQTGIGANIETYSLPSVIKPFYGDHPIGGNVSSASG